MKVFSWYSKDAAGKFHTGASLTFEIFITTDWLAELVPSVTDAVIEYVFLTSKFGASLKVRTPESVISKEDESPPLIEKVRLSLSASEAVNVEIAVWFSSTVNEALDVITGLLSLILVTEISTSWEVVLRSSLKLTLTKYILLNPNPQVTHNLC